MAASGATPFPQLQQALASEVRKRFPGAEPVTDYGMAGWRIRRPCAVEWTHGTVDPNFVSVHLADRRQGTTLHIWNPLDWKGLDKHRAELEEAGFRVMVGCLQFTRKQPYPLDAVCRVLDGMQRLMQDDKGQVPPYKTPRPSPDAASRPSGGKKAGTAARAAAKGRRAAKGNAATPPRAKGKGAAQGSRAATRARPRKARPSLARARKR